MAIHGAILAGCGLYGAGPVGTATGLTMLTCAGMTLSGTHSMTGIHIALLAQAVTCPGFAVQAARSSLALPLWAAMSTSSAVALGTMYTLKPKKAKPL
jgi:hypothetical protein